MMLEQKTTDFLEVLSSAEPVPGGGGASAAVGALFSGCAGLGAAAVTSCAGFIAGHRYLFFTAFGRFLK